eukprot:CAMPEP_0180417320 /NCGR_PEP_ID=MMETSP1036_2-20121128/968_1 /TAXON_ID=632150 /ORGANISM="Azadinium spinosum, Strain 3D9" /LENGTH=99 /DNA_ID=CAMNT_0022422337 /DNA_START=187 /DNA_END=486 /DNA_ORIENTATION=-
MQAVVRGGHIGKAHKSREALILCQHLISFDERRATLLSLRPEVFVELGDTYHWRRHEHDHWRAAIGAATRFFDVLNQESAPFHNLAGLERKARFQVVAT